MTCGLALLLTWDCSQVIVSSPAALAGTPLVVAWWNAQQA
jgi:hypothetical protein